MQTNVTSAKTFYTLNLSGTAGVAMSGAGSLTLLGGGLIGNTSGSISRAGPCPVRPAAGN